jgi:hypothetical protein
MKGFTNRFSRRSNKTVTATLPQPRSMEDIQKEYVDLLSKAAQAGYQAYVYNKELSRLNERLEQVNIEGGQRQKLDKDAAPKAEATNEQK